MPVISKRVADKALACATWLMGPPAMGSSDDIRDLLRIAATESAKWAGEADGMVRVNRVSSACVQAIRNGHADCIVLAHKLITQFDQHMSSCMYGETIDAVQQHVRRLAGDGVPPQGGQFNLLLWAAGRLDSIPDPSFRGHFEAACRRHLDAHDYSALQRKRARFRAPQADLGESRPPPAFAGAEVRAAAPGSRVRHHLEESRARRAEGPPCVPGDDTTVASRTTLRRMAVQADLVDLARESKVARPGPGEFKNVARRLPDLPAPAQPAVQPSHPAHAPSGAVSPQRAGSRSFTSNAAGVSHPLQERSVQSTRIVLNKPVAVVFSGTLKPAIAHACNAGTSGEIRRNSSSPPEFALHYTRQEGGDLVELRIAPHLEKTDPSACRLVLSGDGQSVVSMETAAGQAGLDAVRSLRDLGVLSHGFVAALEQQSAPARAADGKAGVG